MLNASHLLPSTPQESEFHVSNWQCSSQLRINYSCSNSCLFDSCMAGFQDLQGVRLHSCTQSCCFNIFRLDFNTFSHLCLKLKCVQDVHGCVLHPRRGNFSKVIPKNTSKQKLSPQLQASEPEVHPSALGNPGSPTQPWLPPPHQ